jgi:hypothetical protein
MRRVRMRVGSLVEFPHDFGRRRNYGEFLRGSREGLVFKTADGGEVIVPKGERVKVLT